MIKRLIAVLVMAFAMAQGVVSAKGSDVWAGTGTKIGVTNCYFIVSATAGNGVPRVQYINATSDKAGSVITFYTPSAQAYATLATNASQAVVWVDNSATTFSAGDCVVFRRLADDSYQRLTVSSATTTNVTMVQNLGATMAIGDVISKMTSKGTIPVGAATKEVIAVGGMFNGTANKSVLIDIDSTSAGQINVVAGLYEKP